MNVSTETGSFLFVEDGQVPGNVLPDCFDLG